MRKLWTHNYCKKTIGIIGSSLSGGQRKPGVEAAPELFRESGLITALNRLGFNTRDYGNLLVKDFPVKKPSDQDIG